MRPKIYLFGDSITEDSFCNGGWGASLAHHFSRTVVGDQADVVLRGYSGYNTRWALKVFDRVFPAKQDGGDPVAVLIFFGANDACLPDRYGAFQHVPVDEYKQNLKDIVSFIKERWPKTHVLFITPPPIDEASRLEHPYAENPSGEPERTNEAAGTYAKACINVAKDCGSPVADIWSKMQEFPDWRKAYLSDGLHLTENGNRIVFEQIVEKLREVGLTPEKIPVDLPLFADIDIKDPLKAFQN